MVIVPTAVEQTASSGAAATAAEFGGLSEREAARRLAETGRPRRAVSSRSYASIVRANVLTVINLILAVFGAMMLLYGNPQDALFLGIIIANAGIGITQEVRAKGAPDRLSLVVAPRATVKRVRAIRQVPVEEVVVDGLVLLEPGDQIIADGRLVSASDLRLDESVLTGESEPARRAVDAQVRSGAFVVESVGAHRVTAVGDECFASRITGEARSFRHPRSPLERAENRLLYALVAMVIGLGAVLGYSLYHRHVPLHTAVATSSVGVVALIPEGLMVLVSLTHAAAAIRMSRRGVPAQQLNAIESLASVDTICVDKTGTLTEAAPRVVEVLAAAGVGEDTVRECRTRLLSRNRFRLPTLAARIGMVPMEPASRLMERKMLLGIKQRAEQLAACGLS